MARNIRTYSDATLGEQYDRVLHKSGLEIFIYPKDRQTGCAFLSVAYGSIDNQFYAKGKETRVSVPAGIAHFLEHKMFDNEDGSSVDEVFSRLGAEPNAATSFSSTGYYFTCNEAIYQSLAELLRFVTHPYFTDASVKKERGIILQELAMCEDDPYDRCYLAMLGGLYERHPVRMDVVGTEASIKKITKASLYQCYRAFYVPENMKLAVCGRVDTEKVLAIVDQFFGEKQPEASLPRRFYPKERKSSYQSRRILHMQVERPIFCIGFKDDVEKLDAKTRRRRQITAELLVGTLFSSSGALFRELYKKGVMTTPFSYGEEYDKNYAYCYIGGECDDPELLLQEIQHHFEKLKKQGIDRDAFERRQKMLYASDVRMYDSTWEITNALIDDALAGVELFEDAALVSSISPKEAQKLLCELFVERKMTFSLVLPPETKNIHKEKEGLNFGSDH